MELVRRLTDFYNSRTGESVTESNILRMCLEKGASILANEFRAQFGETVYVANVDERSLCL